MKEFDENEAIAVMSKALAPRKVNEDDVCEVLDLIFDFYEDNGALDINDEDEDPSVDEIAKYILKYIDRDLFSYRDIQAMVRAEISYEESLI